MLDASVILKWYFEENLSEDARELRRWIQHEGIGVAIPDYFFIEAANVLWKKTVLLKEVRRIEAWEIFREIRKLPFQIIPVQEILTSVFQFISQHKISVYDGIYLITAHELGAKLITADSAFVHQLKGLSLSTTAADLSNWKTLAS